jgi:parallel beta-helix repeat protein
MRTQLIAALLLTAAAAITIAGPLTPPAGPIASTYKTLGDIEPRIPINAQTCPGGPTFCYGIAQPGSYYLTGDLAGESGKQVIRIGANNVTIDLNGFSIVGGPGSVDGINGDILDISNVTVRNGTIRNCGDHAINTEPTQIGWLIENVRATNNGGGIQLGRHSIVRNCISVANQGTGIGVIWGSTIENCIADNNIRGIVAGYATTITGCSAQYNDDYGIFAFDGSTVTTSSARHNTTDGFRIDANSRISNCTATENGRDGIRLGTGCTATGNSCSLNGPLATELGAGIRATGERNRIEGNALAENYYAIRTEAAGSFIAANTARGHTAILPFSFTAGCTYGPIVAATGPISTTSPWANFSY